MHDKEDMPKTVNEKYWKKIHNRITSFYISIWHWDNRKYFLSTARKHFPELVKTTHGLRETIEKSVNDFDFEELKVHCEMYEELSKKLILRSNFRFRKIA